ncbi:MAG: hypothetical protein SVY10_12140, partial [Thermodesulfobacteriota bacterium]|nr:hypothetical protein [Thermodesulfobacteriota bacterium]
LKIADAIEEVYKNNLDEYYETLAGHYIDGESYEKGAEYCKLAESKAQDTGSLADAIALSEKRVTCLEKLPRTEYLDKKIIDARTSLGLYFAQMSNLVAAKEAVTPIVDLAIKPNYKRRVSQIYAIMGYHSYVVEDNYPQAFKYLAEALQIAEDLNDILSLFVARYWLANALCFACEFEKGLYYFEKALEINAAENSLWGISVGKGSIGVYVYNFQGKIDLGYQTTGEALRLAEESGDTYTKGTVHFYHGISCYYKGLLEEAEEHLLKGSDFCEKINLIVFYGWANMLLGETVFDRAEYKTSQEHYRRAASIWRQGRIVPSYISLSKIALARARVMNNEKDIHLNEIYECYANNKMKWLEGQMLRYIGEILLNIDNQHMNEAEDWIKRAIEANERNGTRFYLGMSYALYADFFKRKGNLSEARENLNKAIEILRECGADGWVEKYEEELARLL